jgi:hypothetical protein
MLTQCNYTEAVWDRTTQKYSLHNYETMAAKGTSGMGAILVQLHYKADQKEKCRDIFHFMVAKLEGT